MNLNKVFLIGRVATQPEMKTTSSGQSVCTLSIATNRIWKDKAGQKKEESQFHRIVLWQKLAEISSQFLNKGSLVMIEGRIQNRSWEDKTGAKRYTTEIVAEAMQLGPRASGETAKPYNPSNNPKKDKGEVEEDDIPIIEDGEEIDVKDIPF
ncbi:MAG: single-stranded DNA-binding protein [Candidatus Pacebacteria bacterium]|nr:single-stranded DNA-binding protein [Candidatus Paceibacterota bacterium]